MPPPKPAKMLIYERVQYQKKERYHIYSGSKWSQNKVSRKSEMASPFNRVDKINIMGSLE